MLTPQCILSLILHNRPSTPTTTKIKIVHLLTVHLNADSDVKQMLQLFLKEQHIQ